jgi:cytochrome oxidase assembly protein ShyY1
VYRFLLRPRWVALTVLLVLAIPVFVLLGQWQHDRYERRHAANQLLERNLRSPAVDAAELTGRDRDLADQDRWRPVTATGRYDTSQELLVRNRSQEGRPGFYVVTPLVLADGSALLVNRGWVRLGASATTRPDVPAPPPGDVRVSGRIRPPETERDSGIEERAGAPQGQVYRIDTALIGQRTPYPLNRAFVELVSQRPAPSAAPAPVPEPEPATEWMNLAYFVQWHLFAALVPVGWVLLVRQEVRGRRPAQDGTGRPGPAEGGHAGRAEDGRDSTGGAGGAGGAGARDGEEGRAWPAGSRTTG